MHHSCFGGDVHRSLHQLAPAQRRQQVSGEDDALPSVLGQTLFDQEVGALA
jgi:hypothetical protein